MLLKYFIKRAYQHLNKLYLCKGTRQADPIKDGMNNTKNNINKSKITKT